MRLFSIFLAGLVFACGSDPQNPPRFVLADEYHAIAVGPWQPDGVLATELRAFEFVLSEITSGSGTASARIQRKDATESAMIGGSFDPIAGNWVVEPFSLALTSSAAETLDVFAVRALSPDLENGRAYELSGHLKARSGSRIFEARILAASADAPAPSPPDPEKISIASDFSEIRGESGALSPQAGFEVFHFRLSSRDPVHAQGRAADDGSFGLLIRVSPGDVLVLRAFAIDVAGAGVLLFVE